MRIPNSITCLVVGAVLYQALAVAHELVHMAIYKAAGIPSRLEVGLFWGQVTPEFVAPDFTLRTGLMVAHSVNECLLPVEILLLFILVILLYGTLEKAKEKQR